MFTLEELLPALSFREGRLIRIFDATGKELCIATCGSIIGYEYRNRMVLSVTESDGDIIIRLAC